MAKLPFLKFYPADYLLGTRSLTDTEKAIWVDILCFMWLNHKARGTLEMKSEDMARLLGRDRVTVEHTLDALKKKDTADVELRPNDVYFILSRRMVADAKELARNVDKQAKHRATKAELSNPSRNPPSNHFSNPSSNQKVTPKMSEDRSQKTEDRFKDSLPAKKGKRAEEITPFWPELVEHIVATWEAKKGAKMFFRPKWLRDLKGLARIYRPFGVMALWDGYLRMDDPYVKAAGHSFEMFVAKLPVLLDGSWKGEARVYEDKLCGSIGEVVASLGAALAAKKV